MGIFLYLCAENKLHSQFESKLSLRSLALFFAKKKITKDMEQRLIGREPLLHPHLLFHIEKNIIFIQYNDYIEYFYYLCDVEKEEPAGF